MTRISILLALFATLLVCSAPLSAVPPTGPGNYSVSAEAKADDPGNLTINSNGGTILSVHIAGKTEGTDYELHQEQGSSRVTITWLTAIVDGDIIDVTGSCQNSGSHSGSVVNPSSSTWQAAP